MSVFGKIVALCVTAARAHSTATSFVQSSAVVSKDDVEVNTTSSSGGKEAIVVLGQSLNQDGSSPNTLLLRAKHAAEKWRELKVLVFPTGGDPAQAGITEAEVMKKQLVDLGVDEKMIMMEDKAYNTCQNAANLIPMLQKIGVTRVHLITSDFHMPRALYLFEAVFQHYKSTDTVFLPSPAPSGCPAVLMMGMGVNGRRLCDRLSDEKRYTSASTLNKFLSQHIPGEAVPMLSEELVFFFCVGCTMLSEERGKAALDQVVAMHVQALEDLENLPKEVVVKSTTGWKDGSFGISKSGTLIIVQVGINGWADKHTDLGKYIGYRIAKLNEHVISSPQDIVTAKKSLKEGDDVIFVLALGTQEEKKTEPKKDNTKGKGKDNSKKEKKKKCIIS